MQTAIGSIKSIFRAIGFDIVKYPPVLPLQTQIRELISQRHINLVFDVGAFQGTFCEMLRSEVKYDGRICSFEPSEDSFAILSRKMKNDPRWNGFQIGLSSNDVQATLNTYEGRGDFNSLLRLRDNDARIFGVNTSPEKRLIQLRRIDSIWHQATSSISEPKVFLKIDTQGHDCEVLAGASAHLEKVVMIQCELAALEIYDEMTPMHETLKILKDLGYSPVGFHAVNQLKDYGGLVPEFDVIFLRQL
jgi:FkbM family methyltransferase